MHYSSEFLVTTGHKPVDIEKRSEFNIGGNAPLPTKSIKKSAKKISESSSVDSGGDENRLSDAENGISMELRDSNDSDDASVSSSDRSASESSLANDENDSHTTDDRDDDGNSNDESEEMSNEVSGTVSSSSYQGSFGK